MLCRVGKSIILSGVLISGVFAAGIEKLSEINDKEKGIKNLAAKDYTATESSLDPEGNSDYDNFSRLMAAFNNTQNDEKKLKVPNYDEKLNWKDIAEATGKILEEFDEDFCKRVAECHFQSASELIIIQADGQERTDKFDDHKLEYSLLNTMLKSIHDVAQKNKWVRIWSKFLDIEPKENLKKIMPTLKKFQDSDNVQNQDIENLFSYSYSNLLEIFRQKYEVIKKMEALVINEWSEYTFNWVISFEALVDISNNHYAGNFSRKDEIDPNMAEFFKRWKHNGELILSKNIEEDLDIFIPFLKFFKTSYFHCSRENRQAESSNITNILTKDDHKKKYLSAGLPGYIEYEINGKRSLSVDTRMMREFCRKTLSKFFRENNIAPDFDELLELVKEINTLNWKKQHIIATLL